MQVLGKKFPCLINHLPASRNIERESRRGAEVKLREFLHERGNCLRVLDFAASVLEHRQVLVELYVERIVTCFFGTCIGHSLDCLRVGLAVLRSTKVCYGAAGF